MFLFLIKKNFFDAWDNMFRLVLVNIGFIVVVALPIFVPPLLPDALGFAVIVAGVLICAVYLAAAARCIKTISDYKGFGFNDFFTGFREKRVWFSGLVYGSLTLVAALIITVVMPFYSALTSPLGILAAVLIFWVFVVCFLSFQFFLSLRSRMDNPIPKTIKKCFLIFFDNTGFCISCFIASLILAVLSVVLVFLLPGPAGILLFLDEALRLRLLKYDWLEENPQEQDKRPKIPWDAILIDERENTGHRSFKSFIFPWKE